MGGRDGLARNIRIYLESAGLEPLYVVTAFCAIITALYIKDFKRWDKLPDWEKGIIVSAAIATVVLSILSVMKLIGIIRY